MAGGQRGAVEGYGVLGQIRAEDREAVALGEPARRERGRDLEWLKSGALRRDDKPAIYYHTIEYRPPYSAPGTPTKVFKGFLSTVELEEFGSGKIYPHENTRAAAKTDRFNLLEACRANFSAIISLYSDPQNDVLTLIERLEGKIEEAIPAATRNVVLTSPVGDTTVAWNESVDWSLGGLSFEVVDG